MPLIIPQVIERANQGAMVGYDSAGHPLPERAIRELSVSNAYPRTNAEFVVRGRFRGPGDSIGVVVAGAAGLVTIASHGPTPCTISGAELVRQVGFAPTVTACERLIFAPGGQLWAMRTHFPGDPIRADVYALATGYVGTITLGQSAPVAFLADGSLVALEQDAADVPVISAYRIAITP